MFYSLVSLLGALAVMVWLFWKLNKIDNEIKPRNAFTEQKPGPVDDGPVFCAPPVAIPKPELRRANLRILGEEDDE